MTLLKPFGLAVASALTLAGCVSLASKPPKAIFQLTADTPIETGTTVHGTLGTALLVTEPTTDGALSVLRIPVRVDGSSIAYLKDAGWVERPARQFRSLLAETLRAKTGGLVVEGIDYGTPGQQVLGGHLLDMTYDASTHAVVVRFDAVLHRTDKTLETRRFEARVPDIAPKPEQVGPALNKAANQVAGEVAAWVSGG